MNLLAAAASGTPAFVVWLGVALTGIGIVTAMVRAGMWIQSVNADRARFNRALHRIGGALADEDDDRVQPPPH